MPNDLNLNITATAKGTEAAFGAVGRQLSTVDQQAKAAGKSLDAVGKIHATPTVEVTVRDQALAKLRADIERAREQVAQGVSMGADTKPAERELARLQATLKRLESDGSKKIVVTADTKQATVAVGELQTALAGLGPAGAAASQLFGKAGLFVGASAAAVGVTKLAANLETTRIGFQNIVRDGGDAMAIFNDIKKFADSTPFEFPELAKAGKTLLTFGVASDQLMTTLKNIGEAAAATGAPVDHLATIFGQMISRGTVSMQDLLQFTNFGVDAFGAMAAATGKSREELQKLQEQGKLTRPYIEAIALGFAQIYSGSIQQQAQTFNGQLSTLVDHLKNAAIAIGDDLLPLAKLLISALNGIAGAVSSGFGSIAIQIGIAVGAGKLLGPMLDSLTLKARAFATAQAAAAEAGAGIGFAKGLKGVAQLLGGPWAIAVTLGIGLLEGFAHSQADAGDQTASFSKDLNFQRGLFEAHNQALLKNEVRRLGLVEASKRLGLSEDDFVQALSGQPEALNRVQAALKISNAQVAKMRELLDNVTLGTPGAIQALEDFTTANGLNDKAITQYIADNKVLQSGFTDTKNTIDNGLSAWREQATLLERITQEVADANPQISKMNAQFDDISNAIDDTNRAMDKLVDNLGIFNEKGADVAETAARQQQALADLSATVEKYGQNVTANKTKINLSTEAGRAEQQAIIDAAHALADNTTARLKNMQASGESAQQILKDYKDQRDALITQLTLIGLNDTAARSFVDTILKAPKDLDVNVIVNGMTELENRVRALEDELHILKFNVEFENNLRNMGLDPNNIISPSLAPPPAVPDGFTTAPTVTGLRGVSPQATHITVPLQTVAPRSTPTVIINVQDRKLADLIDVRIRDAAGESARLLTRRRVVRV